MSNETEKKICCCMEPPPDLRMLFFPDGSKVGVRGLAGLIEALYSEGKPATVDTAEEILVGLEATNFIPSSARREYRNALLDEYKKCVESHKL